MKLLGRLKETVKDKRGNIEILMLLCCLVSVIAFSNFALAIITLDVGKESDNQPIIPSEKDFGDLKTKKNLKEDDLRKLEDKRRKLEAEITEKEKERDRLRELVKETAGSEKVEYQSKLNDQLMELEKQIYQIQKELDETLQVVDRLKQAKGKETDLKKLQDELEKLKTEIEATKQEFAKLDIQAEPTGEKKEILEKEIQELEKQKKEMEEKFKKQRDEFNPWQDFLGETDIKNPLFVECKKDSITLYPYNKTINISDLESSNPFSDYINKHDGIVLLIRPGAVDAYFGSYWHAKKTNLKICYEPVDANRKLNLTKP